jgi:hypothetical protein
MNRFQLTRNNLIEENAVEFSHRPELGLSFGVVT